ncbi:MAG: class I SAM-dependent methyltransferase [Gemmatimonadota bacterium]
MWDERFGRPGYAYGTAPNDFLVEVAHRVPVGPVLCLGEGEGRNATYLAGRGARVTAVDQSPVGLAKARQLAAERGVSITTVCADLADFAIAPAAWDGVVSIFCHLPPALRAAVHARAVAGLRPGGVLVLEAYTPKQLEFGTGGPPVLELLMTEAALRRELAGLRFERLVEVERDVVEGRAHTGRAAVVQVLGVKA